MATWSIPAPDFLIADVGSTIAVRQDGGWERSRGWDHELENSWNGREAGNLAVLLDDLPGLTLQDPSRQSRFKRSYHTPATAGEPEVVEAIRRRLTRAGVLSQVIWSLDDHQGHGLVDGLPEAASKQQALEFLLRQLSRDRSEVLFAGDSGNDLDVLAGPIPAVLVANASDAVREAARRRAREAGNQDALDCARGGVLGMNGNYAAGILEGLLHYHPEWTAVLQAGP